MPLEELEASLNNIIAEMDKGYELDADIKQIIEQYDKEYAWDDINHMELPIKYFKQARAEEMGHMKNKIFKIVKRSESLQRTGKPPPLSTKWVDTDKSHGQGKLNVRSRWVARDFKTKGEEDREDLFCAPPLELLRFLVSRTATRSRTSRGRRRKMLFIDVKKAQLIQKCEEDVYVDLPKEAGCRDDECGKLIHWLYGCRKAGQAWEDHYSKILIGAGFARGAASPVAFYHPHCELWCIVHGGDFTFSGYDEDLTWVEKNHENRIRDQSAWAIGAGQGDVQEIDILGRTIKFEDWVLSWKADPRHRKMVLEH